MKKEDFKNITNEHIETCKNIIRCNGNCSDVKIECGKCPFSFRNSNFKNTSCIGIYAGEIDTHMEDEKLIRSAKEFLKLVKKENTNDEIEDYINSPNHYKFEGLNCETIDIVKARLGKEGFKSFCVGNILKYVFRAEKKNKLEDYKKAYKYLEWLIENEV